MNRMSDESQGTEMTEETIDRAMSRLASSTSNVTSDRTAAGDLTAEEQIHAAMAFLSDELTAEFKEACRFAPEVVEKESNPRWFLSFHPTDPLAAARRLANYWKKRKEIFKERAFLRINLSGRGALTADDVKMLKTGSFVNLPRDKKNRSVIYIDVSKRRDATLSPRAVFFFIQCLMENEVSRLIGFRVICNISNPFAANFSSSNAKCSRFLMDHCMPIQSWRVYFFHIPPPGGVIVQSFIDTIFTWGVNRVVSYLGASNMISHVVSSKEECLTKLLEYDFTRDGLPVGLGGSWTGGCEPWRKGRNSDDSDDLTLEIETDLSCLLRNCLWLHNQVVTAQQQQSSLSSSWRPSLYDDENTDDDDDDEKNTMDIGTDYNEQTASMLDQAKTKWKRTSEPPEDEDDRKMPALVTNTNQDPQASMGRDVKRTRRKPSPKQSPPTDSTATLSSNSMGPPPPRLPAAGFAAVAATASTAAGVFARAASPAAAAPSRSRLVETIEQRDARRARENHYGRRKRERERHLVEGLMHEQQRLTTSNNALRIEGNRLQGLLDAAKQEIQK